MAPTRSPRVRRAGALAARVCLCLVMIACASAAARAAELRVLCVVALRSTMTELVPQFERAASHQVSVDFDTAGAIAARVERGERADVAFVTAPQAERLRGQGKIQGDIVAVAKLGAGVFVRRGAPKPDIATPQAFRRMLVEARSIGHADPARGGATAIYVAGLLQRLDATGEIRSKVRLFQPGVYTTIANGEVELGFASIAEILADPSVDLVGPLPADLQDYTVFAAVVVAGSPAPDAARALLPFMSSPAAAAVMKARGFEAP